MSLNYRNKSNEPIDFESWAELKNSEELTSAIVMVEDKEVSINKRYFGTVGSVFKVWVDCSSDLADYYGYIKHYEGEQDSENDFARLLEEISEGNEIFDKTFDSAKISIYFDARFSQHIVIDDRVYPEVDYCFNNREEAEIKYNSLIGE